MTTAIEQIVSLKHRYLRACDAKDPDTFRDCFLTRGALIDYGPLGTFDDADPIADIFRKIALKKVDGQYVVLDMHHAFHPEIKLIEEDRATGKWTLAFRQVDLIARTEKIASLEYEDEYRIEGGRWKISRCRSIPLWSITRPLGENTTVEIGSGLQSD